MQIIWKITATVAYLIWAFQLPEWVGPYPTERIVVILLYILLMMYERPKP